MRMLLLAVLAATAAAQTLNQPLFVRQTAGLYLGDGMLMLPRRYRQDAAGAVWIEAEHPTRFVSTVDGWPLGSFLLAQEPTAVRYLLQGTYEIDVDRPMTLRLWYRASFPTAGNWQHTEQLDDTPERVVVDFRTDDANDPNIGQWLWRKGELYELAAGAHTFGLDWQGGTCLDRLAFLPDGVDPPADLPPPTWTAAEQGEAVCYPLPLLPGQTLQSLRVSDGSYNRSASQALISTDAGATWRPVPTNADLTARGIAGPAEMLCKFILRAADPATVQVAMPLFAVVAAAGRRPVTDGLPTAMLDTSLTRTLVPATWTGLRPGREWTFAKPALPGDRGAIWLDAATADGMVFSPADQSWVETDATAAAGKAVYQGFGNRNLFSWDVATPIPATWRPWLRLRLHTADVRVHDGLGGSAPWYPKLVYQVDREEPVTIDFRTYRSGVGDFPRQAFQEQQWVWLPAPPVELAAGHHVFRLREGLDYCLLDRVVLAPEHVVPDGPGGASRREPLRRAEIRFHPLNTVTAADLAALSVGAMPGTDPFTFEYSVDGGQTYRRWRQGPGATGDELLLRARIELRGDEYVERLTGFAALLAGTPEPRIRLANAAQRVFFDGRTGLLCGWWSREAGCLLPEAWRQPLFSVLVGDRTSGYRKVTQADAALVDATAAEQDGRQTLTLRYALIEGYLTATVTAELPADGLLDLRLEIDNRSNYDVKDIHFPMVRGLRVGGDPEALCSVPMRYLQTGQPDTPGAPWSMLERRPSKASSIGHHVYPGHYSMGWTCCYGPDGGFTVQTRNPDAVGTYIGMEPDPDMVGLTVDLARLQTVEAGRRGVFAYAAGWHPGDWHRAADHYSDWAHSWMDFTTYVNRNWARDVDAMVSGWRYMSAFVATRYATHLVPELQWLGANYCMHYFTSLGLTVYGIDPRLGTFAETREANEASARQGVYHTYYQDLKGAVPLYETSPYVYFTPKSQLPPAVKVPPPGYAARGSCKTVFGKSLGWHWLQPLPGFTLCTAADEVRQYHLQGIVDTYSRGYGAHGVYTDEAHGFERCDDTTHAHGKQYGQWSQGMQAIFKQALDQARVDNPDFILLGEGFPDQSLQFEDFGTAGGSAQFLYTIPEAKFFMSDLHQGSREENIRFQHLYARYYAMTQDAANFRRFFQHRGRIRDWMYAGRFRDDVGLTVDRPGIVAKWFDRRDATHTGAVVNIQNEFAIADATLTLARAGCEGVDFALAYLLDEEEVVRLPCHGTAEDVRLQVPAAKASTILLALRLPAAEALRAHLVWPRAAGDDRLVLYAANFGRQPCTAAVAYALPDGVELRDPPATLTVAPHDLARVELPVTGIAALPRLAPVEVTLTTPAGAVACRALVAPPLANGGFETDTAGTGTPDGWRTFGYLWYTHLFPNRHCPVDVTHADGTLDPDNPAEGQYSLRLDGAVDCRNYWSAWRYMLTPELAGKREEAPLRPWYFNTGHELILKPATTYRLSFQYRTAAAGAVLEVSSGACNYGTRDNVFPTQRLAAPADDRGWQTWAYTFTMPPDRAEILLGILNKSATPVWIDNVRVDRQ